MKRERERETHKGEYILRKEDRGSEHECEREVG